MYNKEGLEFACDELAEIIDAAQGVIDVEQAITDLIKKICNHDAGVVAETFRPAMLEQFDEIYQCDPATFAENSQWAHEIEDEVPSEDVFDQEGDLVSLDDLDNKSY